MSNIIDREFNAAEAALYVLNNFKAEVKKGRESIYANGYVYSNIDIDLFSPLGSDSVKELFLSFIQKVYGNNITIFQHDYTIPYNIVKLHKEEIKHTSYLEGLIIQKGKNDYDVHVVSYKFQMNFISLLKLIYFIYRECPNEYIHSLNKYKRINRSFDKESYEFALRLLMPQDAINYTKASYTYDNEHFQVERHDYDERLKLNAYKVKDLRF